MRVRQCLDCGSLALDCGHAEDIRFVQCDYCGKARMWMETPLGDNDYCPSCVSMYLAQWAGR